MTSRLAIPFLAAAVGLFALSACGGSSTPSGTAPPEADVVVKALDGIAWNSVARAAWQNVRNARVISGASTIAMQVARMQHPRTRTLFAKLHEGTEGLLLVRKHGHAGVWVQTNQTGTRWIYTLRTNGAWVDGMSGDDGPAVTLGQRAKFWDTTAL